MEQPSLEIAIFKQKSIKLSESFELKDLVVSCKKCGPQRNKRMDQNSNYLTVNNSNVRFCNKCLETKRLKIKKKKLKLIDHILQLRLQKYMKVVEKLGQNRLGDILEQLKQLNLAEIVDEEYEDHTQTQTTGISQLHQNYSKQKMSMFNSLSNYHDSKTHNIWNKQI